MSGVALGLCSFPALLALIFLRVPIATAMFALGFAGIWLLRGSPAPALNMLKTLSYGTFSTYSFSIIPLFLLMGQFAAISGLSERLFRAADGFLGHRRGGIAMASIGACAGFGAICGSSMATAATMTQIALPELRRRGTSGALATGTLAAGGTLGILIPPSVILIIYALLAQENIERLFIAALLPGLLAAVGYMLTIALVARLAPGAAGTSARLPARQRWARLAATWPVLALFLLVVGGIYGGWFTPTEAAAVGAAGTALAAAASGRLDRARLVEAILGTASASAMMFLIVLGAALFNTFLALTRLPQLAADWVAGAGLAPMTVLGAMLLLYLLFGCVMDSLSMILLTVPIFLPIASALDFGLSPADFGLWFGILILIVVEVGLITPPVGMNLFIINGMAPDIPIAQTYRGVWPFVLSDLIRVALLVAFPVLTLGLVHLLY